MEPDVAHAPEPPTVHWVEQDVAHAALWRSESGRPPPTRIQTIDDGISADAAYGLACQGVGLLWRGDFHNARQLLTAMAQRADRAAGQAPRNSGADAPAALAFHRHRQARSQRARTLDCLLLQLDEHYDVAARRAPDVRAALSEVYGLERTGCVMSLRALLGLIGAHEWRTRGVWVAQLGGAIYPHYGVFAPIRSEYLQLIADAPLPAAIASCSVAFDIGTGTAVVAALLARRGLRHIIATDLDPRALQCARDNLTRLGLTQVEVQQADLYPAGRAGLVVCNPPWLPARPSSPIERGIYDPQSAMLRGFLGGLAAHLAPQAEGWLILSDLAEHLELRSRAQLLQLFAAAGLTVVDRHEIRPRHPKATQQRDILSVARQAEVTSLWRLAPTASCSA